MLLMELGMMSFRGFQGPLHSFSRANEQGSTCICNDWSTRVSMSADRTLGGILRQGAMEKLHESISPLLNTMFPVLLAPRTAEVILP